MTNRDWSRPHREKLIADRGATGGLQRAGRGDLGYYFGKEAGQLDPTATKVKCRCGRKYRWIGEPVTCSCGQTLDIKKG